MGTLHYTITKFFDTMMKLLQSFPHLAAVDGTKLSRGDVVIFNSDTGVYGPKGTRWIITNVRSGEGRLSNLMLVEFHEEGKPGVLKVLHTTSFPWKNDFIQFIAPVTAPSTPERGSVSFHYGDQSPSDKPNRTRVVSDWMRRRLAGCKPSNEIPRRRF